MTLHQSWFARDSRGWICEPPDGAAAAFHRRLPGYAATPLAQAPGLAAELGLGRLFVKDESARFDLRPAGRRLHLHRGPAQLIRTALTRQDRVPFGHRVLLGAAYDRTAHGQARYPKCAIPEGVSVCRLR